jgi:hypothetical protein
MRGSATLANEFAKARQVQPPRNALKSRRFAPNATPPNPPLTLTTPNGPSGAGNVTGGRTNVDAHTVPCYPMSSRQIVSRSGD